ncbi:MAG TPA: alanine-tRNA synthetase second additional domain-containing protein [Firmicutes bacterium]|nr:alanine-tRNA synthetase second additional domain-containing protein [Bacillota bacterium]
MQHQNLREAVYFAPRGKERLLYLGNYLAQRYLDPSDRLIGFIGPSGMGKSLLIRGMFPGLELTNDDENINVRPLPLVRDIRTGSLRTHTYHVDVRFEMAFVPLSELAACVKEAVLAGRRVVVEHFDTLAPMLPMNAELLVGVGEEAVVTRPTVFGPRASEIASRVFESSRYRKMVHTAEDLTTLALLDLEQPAPDCHSDLPHGFVLEYKKELSVDLTVVERKVQQAIKANLPVTYYDEGHIRIGDRLISCTGPRIHVSRTADIQGFSLEPKLCFDPLSRHYLLVGTVGNAPKEMED